MRKNKPKGPAEQKKVRFGRLTFQALPEMWSFQLLSALLMTIPTTILNKMISMVAESGGGAVTTANLKFFILSWRAPVILVLALILAFVFLVMELLAKIHMCDHILTGQRSRIFSEIRSSIHDLRYFFTSDGILTLIYILFAVPLCGIGFSLSVTRHFYIPNFIMSVVTNNPLYAVGYLVLLLFLIRMGYYSAFKIHAVLIDGQTMKEAQASSREIIRKHGKEFLLTLLKVLIVIGIIKGITYAVFCLLPEIGLIAIGEDLPRNAVVDVMALGQSEASDESFFIVGYRVISAFCVLMGNYLYTITSMLCSSYFILRFTRCYMDYTRGPATEWLERPKKSRYYRKVLMLILVIILVVALSLVIGIAYNQIFRAESVRIIAHRTGGTMASENSLEGLYEAIDHGCYGSETDTQRTRDGYYIINHDDNFKRLTGVNKTPQSMTLEEVRQLQITDTTGSGAKLQVPTLEEMLDIIKGKEKLFIELKGATADTQMADDVVRMVREKDCVNDVVIISLKYDIIDYTETNYPEFETGLLLFGAIGDISRLNCDLLIMEEETSTDVRIVQIHNAGKQAIVWTVNTESSMEKFLDSAADAIITDEVVLAQSVQERLNARTDYEVINDKFKDIWN